VAVRGDERSTRSRSSRAPVRRWSEGTPARPTLRPRWRAVVECFKVLGLVGGLGGLGVDGCHVGGGGGEWGVSGGGERLASARRGRGGLGHSFAAAGV
jgi:hypothetical protein